MAVRMRMLSFIDIVHVTTKVRELHQRQLDDQQTKTSDRRQVSRERPALLFYECHDTALHCTVVPRSNTI